tara:strand:+ start:54 stop:566 length:513 start_codon:yes stop_codon:yes gene_type:complete
MNFTNLQHLINGKFNRNDCNNLVVGNKQIRELFNFTYKLDKYSCFTTNHIEPESREDEVERCRLIEKTKELYKYFEKDLHTRQAVVQMKYNDKPELASCLSSFQFIVRNDRLFLFVFVRSQNYDKNFKYDNDTYFKMCSELFNILSTKNNKLKFGEINVKITSLHRFIES